MYQNFIGIDIGKATFVVGFPENKDTFEFENSLIGFEKFHEQFAQILPTSLVVLETTGGYEMALVSFLYCREIKIHRANTRKVKFFIRSLGQEAKTDKIDSQGLAKYGEERHKRLELFAPKNETQIKLMQYSQRRLDINQMLVQEKNRAKAPDINPWVHESCLNMIECLGKEIKSINEKIDLLIEADPERKAKKAVLVTIDGIGDVTSCLLLSLLPELGRVNRRQIASLVGLAPYPRESGMKVGYRSTRGGREDVRSALFMSAMTASRSKGRLGQFYQSLIARGKKKMVALTALMRKIIVIANARLAEWYDANAVEHASV